MDIKKIIGWVLFGTGLLIIFWGLYSSFSIFTGKNSAPEIFEAEKTADLSQEGKTGSLSIEDQIKDMMGEQIKEALPFGFLPKILNLVSWSIFAGILFIGGGMISGLGIKLIKAK